MAQVDAGAPNANIDINDERAVRRARRQALIDAGVNPYPATSTVTAHAAELEERYASLEDGASTKDAYSVAGRVRALRKQGRSSSSVVSTTWQRLTGDCSASSISVIS